MMASKFFLFFSLVLTVLSFHGGAAAQTIGEGTIAAGDSKLTAISLASGARRVKNGMAPAEVREVLEKLIAQGGDKVKQGDSEILLWGGNYETAKGGQMIHKLENDLKRSGWTYELAAKEQGVTIFTLVREEPARQALVGFFAPMKESFVFAVTEMLPAETEAPAGNGAAEASETSNVSADTPVKAAGGNGRGSSKIIGKWMRSDGAGGNDDGTGKTRYSSGIDTTFIFNADGTMQVTIKKDVLAITQCTINELTKIPGTYTVSGDQITMNLSVGTATGKSTCDRAGNFNKKLTASTLEKSFVVRTMKSPFRPDEPLLLCLDGKNEDNECFERDPKY